jgi:hypothetical protein
MVLGGDFEAAAVDMSASSIVSSSLAVSCTRAGVRARRVPTGTRVCLRSDQQFGSDLLFQRIRTQRARIAYLTIIGRAVDFLTVIALAVGIPPRQRPCQPARRNSDTLYSLITHRSQQSIVWRERMRYSARGTSFSNMLSRYFTGSNAVKFRFSDFSSVGHRHKLPESGRQP